MGTVEQQVLEYIIRHKVTNDGASPSYRQIADSCNIGSTSTVRDVLDRLEDAGRIYRESGQCRSISVPGGRWVFEGCPMHTERVARR